MFFLLRYLRFCSVFSAAGPSLKKYPMNHFVVLTPHEQLIEAVLHTVQGMFYQGFVEPCGPPVHPCLFKYRSR